VSQPDLDYALAKANEWGYDIDQMIIVDHPAGVNHSN
jgi:apolipoprotein D and lipocalin family protein